MAAQQTMATANPAASAARSTPQWYKDAKFGIFVHWGPASVPGWAPQTTLNTQEMIKQKGLTYYFKNNPYAEWYFNSMRVPDSPTQHYHQQNWGSAPYDIFGQKFNEISASGNYRYFAQWADLFARAGARYVVPVAKHHDGFTLWPTRVKPRKPDWSAQTDLIGKLHAEVLARNMKMGVYYSGLYDWTWNATGIRNGFTAAINGYQSPETVAYMDGHVRELIALYRPSVLWNDIGYVTHPDAEPFKLSDLWAEYYAAVPDGAIDDRWFEIPAQSDRLYPYLTAASQFFAEPAGQGLAEVIDAILKVKVPAYDKPAGGLTFPISTTHDYRTYEYEVPDDIQPDKWELVRGVGLSFCYNRNELPSQWLTFEELAWMFVDVVSKNGNLLLNVGPMADGSLQDHEVKLLEDFGAWMKIYGDALYDTTPWSAIACNTYASLSDIAGPTVRFTEKGGMLNVFVKLATYQKEVLVRNVQPIDGAVVSLRAGPGERIRLEWRKGAAGTYLTLPANLPAGPVLCVSIDPAPKWTG
jgi:alpha-L-fucosidase